MSPLDFQIGQQLRDERLNLVTLSTPTILKLPIGSISWTVASIRNKEISSKFLLKPFYYRLIGIRNADEGTESNPCFLTVFSNRKSSFTINKTSKIDDICFVYMNHSITLLKLIFKGYPEPEPSDLRGIPIFSKDAQTTVWLPPEFFPRKGCGIIFFDELNLSPPLVQASAYQLILDRRLGTYCVPDGYTLLAAGNRLEDRAIIA